jgi:hypothetical protein
MTLLWISSQREVVIARLRILFDFLQTAGLLVLVKFRGEEWFVTGVLSMSGGVIGGGFSIQTWLPYLCSLTKDRISAYWVQLSAALMVVPVAALTAVLSRGMVTRVWHVKRSSVPFVRTFALALVMLEYGVFFAIVRAAASGLSLQAFDQHPFDADVTGKEDRTGRRYVTWVSANVVIIGLGYVIPPRMLAIPTFPVVDGLFVWNNRTVY